MHLIVPEAPANKKYVFVRQTMLLLLLKSKILIKIVTLRVTMVTQRVTIFIKIFDFKRSTSMHAQSA